MTHDDHDHLPRGSSLGATSMADFDEAAYRPYLDGLDITDENASALMRIVHDIMRMWVEMDLPVDTCGQIIQSIILPNHNGPDSID